MHKVIVGKLVINICYDMYIIFFTCITSANKKQYKIILINRLTDKNENIQISCKIFSLCLQARGKKRQKGWFPASHVKLLGSNSGKSTPASAAGEKQHKYPGLIYFSLPLSSLLSLFFLPIVGQVIAIYDYNAANEDELSFSKSQIINVLDKSNPDWWKGELNGVTGLIPTNYVKVTTSDSDPSQQCK